MHVKDCGRDLVLGFGKTGYSLTRYLTAQGRQVDVFDTRVTLPYPLDGLDNVRRVDDHSALQSQYTTAFVSPGLPASCDLVHSLRQAGARISNDIALFCSQCDQPIYAVTGSNGKSSVVSMMHFALRCHGVHSGLGGNIGKPVIEFLNEPQCQCYCLELSSFQLELVGDALQPEVACMVNFSEDHMDRYHSIEDYRQAKLHIYRQAKYTVVNADDTASCPVDRKADMAFSLTQNGDNIVGLDGRTIVFEGKPILEIDSLKVVGRHNVANVAASLAMLYLAGYSMQTMAAYLIEYTGLAYRFALTRKKDGVLYINDSKATNIGATRAALMSCQGMYAGRLILIAGGDSKGADLVQLGDHIAGYVDYLLVLGKDAQAIAQAVGQRVPTVFVISMEQAVDRAMNYVRPGDLVLLSPACSSTDMFDNFEHRGQVFDNLVKAL